MTDKRSGMCTVCGRRFRIRLDGGIWHHRGRELVPWIWPEPPCKGWGQPPAEKDNT